MSRSGWMIFMPSSGSPEYTAPVTMNGVLWISGGVCSLAGSVVHPMIAEISSGAVAAQSRNCRYTFSASSTGWNTPANATIGPTGWHWNVNEVTTPKLPPPPRMAQNRSGFESADAVRT